MRLPYKSILRVMCMITIFCLAQVLPMSNYFRPREIINITQVQPSDSNLQETIRKVIPACVLIEVRGQYDYNYQPIKWSGSGVIVSENGVIVTAGHVVKDAVEIKIILSDGRGYKAVSFEYENTTDLGIIKIPANGLPIISLGDSNKQILGNSIFTIGCPFGETLFNTVTVGVISGLKRDISFFGEKLLLQIDAATAPGKSGGGVFDMEGNLIGIMVGMRTEYDDINLCVPSNIVKLVINKYCKRKNLENAK
ncbi:hypothetical protein LCGC14_1891750 [marine sediment metagenome]|uniref:Serine protease n=1 Tax=marine sediment metagenome TaxID=412755 RepID=A0A0F9IXD9_9ZZZZ